MKTFGLFILVQFFCMVVIALALKDAKTEDILKYMFAYQIAFIMYKLIKEDDAKN
jgi:hypothetical protein